MAIERDSVFTENRDLNGVRTQFSRKTETYNGLGMYNKIQIV